MKKILSLILAFAFIFTLTSCGEKAPTWQEQYDLGIKYLNDGNYEEAIIAFTAAIEIEPKNSKLYIGLADSYLNSGNTEKAEEVLRKAEEALGENDEISQRLQEILDADIKETDINEETFPDAVFRQYVSETFDEDGDDHLSKDELRYAYTISVSGNYGAPNEIYSLKGIEYFKNLVWLDCFYCKIDELDVSGNSKLQMLAFDDNPIRSIDLSNNYDLKILNCGNCLLESIDTSQNPNLEDVNLINNKISRLDLSKNPKLNRLICSDNLIESIDVSSCTELEDLRLDNNKLKSLDVSNCKKLLNLSCWVNEISELDVSNCPQLEKLNCAVNNITQLDLSNNPKITRENLIVNDDVAIIY